MAFCGWKKNKVWLWKAFDPVNKKLIGFEIGKRDDKTCQKLLDKLSLQGKSILTDDWDAYHRLIPEDQHFTGKDLTFNIEQDNSNTRHYLARFRRKSKCTSRSKRMVELSLILLHNLQHKNLFQTLQQKFLNTFS